MIKRKLLTAVLTLASMSIVAQQKTTLPTHYREYRPSVVTFTDGHQSNQQFTNVFLKNSSLLFLSSNTAMEANMSNIVRVDFADRSYINLNGQLAYLVDSVGANKLYCIELFDLDSYERNLRNNVNYTDISLAGDNIGTTTVDLNNEEDYKIPVVPHYYYYYQGTFVRVKDREVWRKLPKAKRRQYKTIVSSDDFSWVKPDQLMLLLKSISE